MSDGKTIRIEVVYALSDKAFLHEMSLTQGTTVADALQLSGVYEAHPEIDLATHKVGVYGKVHPLDHELHDGDRVEIYRPVKAKKVSQKAET